MLCGANLQKVCYAFLCLDSAYLLYAWPSCPHPFSLPPSKLFLQMRSKTSETWEVLAPLLTKLFNSKALHLQSLPAACDQCCEGTLIAGAKCRPGRAVLGWFVCCSETTLEVFYFFFPFNEESLSLRSETSCFFPESACQMELLFVNWKQNHICSDWLEGQNQWALHAKEMRVADTVATWVGHISFLCDPFGSLSLPPSKKIQNYKAAVNGSWFYFQ